MRQEAEQLHIYLESLILQEPSPFQNGLSLITDRGQLSSPNLNPVTRYTRHRQTNRRHRQTPGQTAETDNRSPLSYCKTYEIINKV